MYVIKKNNLYVSKPGMEHSYTSDIAKSQKFQTKEQAEKSKCENEYVVNVYDEIR